MKNIIIIILILISFNTNASTEGTIKLDKIFNSEVNHTGTANFSNATFEKKVNILGMLLSDNVTYLNDLNVNGKANLNKTFIKQNLYIQGIATINHLKLNGNLYLKGDEGSNLSDIDVRGTLYFTGNSLNINGNSNFSKIIVRPSQEHSKNPIINFGKNSRVLKNIIFENCEGSISKKI